MRVRPYSGAVEVKRDQLAAWCAEAIGSEPVETIFDAGHLSRVVGYRLQDGREVVIKARPPAERVLACLDMHMYAWANGYPCPQPLAGPTLLHSGLVTAESYVAPGDAWQSIEAAPKSAEALARLVALTGKTSPRLPLELSLIHI